MATMEPGAYAESEHYRIETPYDQLKSSQSSLDLCEERKPACSSCGTLFSGVRDVRMHAAAGCPMLEMEDDGEDDDDSFIDLINKVYEITDGMLRSKIQMLEKEMDAVDAKKHALDLMIPRYKKLFLQKYGKCLATRYSMEHSAKHRKVLAEIKRLMDWHDYSAEEAVKKALIKYGALFDELIQPESDEEENEEVETEEEENEEVETEEEEEDEED